MKVRIYYKLYFILVCNTGLYHCIRAPAINYNAALSVVPRPRAEAAELARADCGARRGGAKLRLATCSGTF
jgi:hypothetical protein